MTETAPVTATVTAPVTASVTAFAETGLGPGMADYTVPMLGIPSFKKGDDKS